MGSVPLSLQLHGSLSISVNCFFHPAQCRQIGLFVHGHVFNCDNLAPFSGLTDTQWRRAVFYLMVRKYELGQFKKCVHKNRFHGGFFVVFLCVLVADDIVLLCWIMAEGTFHTYTPS